MYTDVYSQMHSGAGDLAWLVVFVAVCWMLVRMVLGYRLVHATVKAQQAVDLAKANAELALSHHSRVRSLESVFTKQRLDVAISNESWRKARAERPVQLRKTEADASSAVIDFEVKRDGRARQEKKLDAELKRARADAQRTVADTYVVCDKATRLRRLVREEKAAAKAAVAEEQAAALENAEAAIDAVDASLVEPEHDVTMS